MTSAQGGDYIFEDAEGKSELARLRALEGVFDPATRRRVASVAPLTGRRCLEVGAGAGSIARWLREEVGDTGSVVAVDTSARFLRDLPGVEVVESCVTRADLPARGFDLVHARYVTIHNADGSALIDAMLRALALGGSLVLEEPDFVSARSLAGPAPLREAFDHVNRAIVALFSGRAMDPAWGSQLPGELHSRGLRLDLVELEPHAQAGGSPLARMMCASTEQLASKYVATGHARESDIAGYREFSADADCWGLYYTTVAVVAQVLR